MRTVGREGWFNRVVGPVGLALVLGLSAQRAVLNEAAASQRFFMQVGIPVLDNPDASTMMQHYTSPLEIPKVSPKHGWSFPFVTVGYVKFPRSESYVARFRVFAQSRRAGRDDVAQWGTRMFLRLWAYTNQRLRLDHHEMFRRFVDVYFCFGGEPGGEHKFTVDENELVNGRPVRVNTIYLYQVLNVEQPIQLAREIAHEYGHAILPPVGPFTGPEDWANGDVGERLYLRWLRDDMRAGRIEPDDVMGADLASLDAYVAARVDPLVLRIGSRGPDLALLRQRTPAAFEEYVALATYAGTVLPHRMFSRSLLLTGSQKAEDYERAIREAAAEAETWEVTVPAVLRGKPLFIPLGKGTVSGARVLSRSGGWARVQPTGGRVVVKNPPLEP